MNNRPARLYGYLSLIVVSIAFFNFSGVSITKYMGATTRKVFEAKLNLIKIYIFKKGPGYPENSRHMDCLNVVAFPWWQMEPSLIQKSVLAPTGRFCLRCNRNLPLQRPPDNAGHQEKKETIAICLICNSKCRISTKIDNIHIRRGRNVGFHFPNKASIL